jgi:hypothetical protein
MSEKNQEGESPPRRVEGSAQITRNQIVDANHHQQILHPTNPDIDYPTTNLRGPPMPARAPPTHDGTDFVVPDEDRDGEAPTDSDATDSDVELCASVAAWRSRHQEEQLRSRQGQVGHTHEDIDQLFCIQAQVERRLYFL